jgi:RNA polymerase sigma-70 factor (ECF subfamily)
VKDDSNHGPLNPTELVQALFIKHEGVIRAFERGLAPSFDKADDIIQETFVTVSRKARSFEAGTDFVAWACSIARFKALESYRQRKRAGTLSEAAILALSEDFQAAEVIRAREATLNPNSEIGL